MYNVRGTGKLTRINLLTFSGSLKEIRVLLVYHVKIIDIRSVGQITKLPFLRISVSISTYRYRYITHIHIYIYMHELQYPIFHFD